MLMVTVPSGKRNKLQNRESEKKILKGLFVAAQMFCTTLAGRHLVHLHSRDSR